MGNREEAIETAVLLTLRRIRINRESETSIVLAAKKIAAAVEAALVDYETDETKVKVIK